MANKDFTDSSKNLQLESNSLKTHKKSYKPSFPGPSYGESEIRKNQDWYMLTALAVSCVVFWQMIFLPIQAGWIPDFAPDRADDYKRKTRKVYQLKSLRKKYVDDTNYPYSFPDPASCKDFYKEKPIPLKYAPRPFYNQADTNPLPVNLWCVWDAIGCPKYMKGGGKEGSVKAIVFIDKKGRYKYHSIYEMVQPRLVERVENYISRLQFTPAIKDGKAIEYWMDVSFPFYEELK